ncbi:MAG TPA: hypothetical protein VHB21_19125 [Minicystis sp.]|nr:hypothetical protein [Minicystis sp.]
MQGPTAPRPLVGWIVGGAGVAALGVTTVLWAVGVSEESNLRSTCGVTHSCTQAAVDASHGKLVAGDVIGVFGAAAVIAGGAILLFYKPTPSSAVSFAPLPGGGSFAATARF